MLHIAICEDSPHHMEIILALLHNYKNARPGVTIQPHSFADGDKLLDCLDKGQAFDLYLLDILMPGLNGIELAGELRLRDAEVPLVFLTSSADYALDAFNVSAMHYILKPVEEEALFQVLDKIVSVRKQENDRFLLVKAVDQKVKIPFSRITCVESVRRTLRIYLTDGSKLDSKTIRVPFETAIAPLLGDSRFLHAHKSFVLNMAHVERLTVHSFMMNDGTEVPIPRYKYADAKNKYLNYLSTCGIGLLGGQ